MVEVTQMFLQCRYTFANLSTVAGLFPLNCMLCSFIVAIVSVVVKTQSLLPFLVADLLHGLSVWVVADGEGTRDCLGKLTANKSFVIMQLYGYDQ